MEPVDPRRRHRNAKSRSHKHAAPSPHQKRGEGERSPAPHSIRSDPSKRNDSNTRPRYDGSFWLYGIHAVEAALANPARRLRRLVLTEEAEAVLTTRLPKPWAIPGERIDRDRLDHILGRGIVHQGIALQTDPLPGATLADALKRPGPVLVLDQITDPRNVGAILRSAQAFGAALVITQDRNAPHETGALAKAASGALEKILLIRTTNIARALIALKASGLWILGLDAGGKTRLNGSTLGGRRVALVLGAEGEGMRRLTRETCDELVFLPMPGGMESLNVSAAAAIALYEITQNYHMPH